ncbi:hypothetical protein M9Y10_036136 [Tritrichomonas musculus]|uniref:SWI5-dependent HO expression protein 3 n=1 Tax=Tritrichomonas musculus TaxID=1915356 RepID=A0ABR2GWH5_9EUKA
MASRAPTVTTNATSAFGRMPADIKPANVHELKLKTQQILLKTRQLRTQVNRINDRITSETNAINRTFEQQTDNAPVSLSHDNSLKQLNRSVQSAENTLDNLKQEIEKLRYNDKTYIVGELREEVKLAYCENQRLTQELQQKNSECNSIDKQLQEASRKASNAYINELKSKINEIKVINSDLRDKADAYRSKRAKLLIEQTIAGHQEKKVNTQTIIDEANTKNEETAKSNNQTAEELQNSKKEYEEKVAELQAIIDKQRQKIKCYLTGEPLEQEEQENQEGGEEEDKNKEEDDQ